MRELSNSDVGGNSAWLQKGYRLNLRLTLSLEGNLLKNGVKMKGQSGVLYTT